MMKINTYLLLVIALSCSFFVHGQNKSIQLSKTSEAIQIDGEMSPKEWKTSQKIEITRSQDWKIEALVTYDKENIYVALRNLTYPKMAKLNAEILIQTNSKKNKWNENTYWFHSSYSNCEAQGEYFNWESCSNDASGWQANTFPFEKENNNIEFKISFSKLQMTSPDPGTKLRVAFKLTDVSEKSTYWPSKASIEKPASWGEIIF